MNGMIPGKQGMNEGSGAGNLANRACMYPDRIQGWLWKIQSKMLP